jgi:hypothetical protein
VSLLGWENEQRTLRGFGFKKLNDLLDKILK